MKTSTALLVLTTLLAGTPRGAGQAPSNDNFINRQPLLGTQVSWRGISNVSATKEPGEPNHAGNRGGKSVWWTWTALVSGRVVVDTIGSDFDTLLAVYSGNALTSLTLVAANDEMSGDSSQSRVLFFAQAGTTYQIAVDGYFDTFSFFPSTVYSGSITLNLLVLGDCPLGSPVQPNTPPILEINNPRPNDTVLGSVIPVSGSVRLNDKPGLDLLFVLDSSGSLTATDPKDFRKQGVTNLVQAIPPNADVRIGVVDFDEYARVVQPLTRNYALVLRSLDQLDQSGWTSAGEGIAVALNEFARTRRPDANAMIILFSDGESDGDPVAKAIEAGSAGVTIHSVFLSVGSTYGADVMSQIAAATCGTFRQTTDSSALAALFTQFLGDTLIDRIEVRSDASSAPPLSTTVLAGFWNVQNVPIKPVPGAITTITATAYTSEIPPRTGSAVVQVVFATTNSPPTIQPIANQTVSALSTLTIQAVARDSDLPSQKLTYSLRPGAPSGATIDSSSGLFTWRPALADALKSFSVTIEVFDSGVPVLAAATTFTINVINSNPPRVSAIPDITIVVNQPVPLISFTVDDVETPASDLKVTVFSSNQTLLLSVRAFLGSSVDGTNRTLTLLPTTNQVGKTTVTVTVTDRDGLSTDRPFVLTVEDHRIGIVSVPDQVIDEEKLFTWQMKVSDPIFETQPLTFSLAPGSPPGANITTTGIFWWTPTEEQGPGTFPISVRVTANGTANQSASGNFTIAVREVNKPPVLDSINPQTAKSSVPFTLRLQATDPDIPKQAPIFSKVNGPVGATVSPDGNFQWVPPTDQEGKTVTVTVGVADAESSPPSDTKSFTIFVVPGNPPFISSIADQRTPVGTPTQSIVFTVTDKETPPENLIVTATSSDLKLIPPGFIGISTGGSTRSIVVTPAPNLEGVALITVTVKDGDGFTASSTFKLTVFGNSPPVLDPTGPKSTDEGTLLSFVATAQDPDVPPQRLTFTLPDAPPGASITDSGLFSWIPSENQGPSTNQITIKVSDDGNPSLTALTAFTVVVREVNRPPTLDPIATQTVTQGDTVQFLVSANDPDIPKQALLFGLSPGAPIGATISNVNNQAIFIWKPTCAQAPSTNLITVQVADSGSPPASDSRTFAVIVNESAPPTLSFIDDLRIKPNTSGVIQFTVFDPDSALGTLKVVVESSNPTLVPLENIVSAGSGTNRVLTITPVLNQVGITRIFISAKDPCGHSASTSFQLTVTSNEGPTISPIPDQTINEEVLFTWPAKATSPNVFAQQFTLTLPQAPSGAGITPNGFISWQPTEEQGPSTNLFTVKVTDNAIPPQSATTSFRVIVQEVNRSPVLDPIASQTAQSLVPFLLNLKATDPDIPKQPLIFSLITGPSGVSVSQAGVFQWTPTVDQEGKTYSVTVGVTDRVGSQPSDTETFNITVVSFQPLKPPAIVPNPIPNQATAPGVPTQKIPFTLVDATPPPVKFTVTGASSNTALVPNGNILFNGGETNWTVIVVPMPQLVGTTRITITVSNETSHLTGNSTFELNVLSNTVNHPPLFDPIPARTNLEQTLLSFQIKATDPDVPPQSLTFSLDNAPTGASITPAGNFTWTPSEVQGPGSYPITVQVTDDGNPPKSATTSFTVVVLEANQPPVFNSVPLKMVDEETLLSFSVTATDPDLPSQTLTYALISAPTGVSISSTGILSWTPAEIQGPNTYQITVRVTDNGTPTLSATNIFSVTVGEVNRPPVLDPINPRSIRVGETVSLSANFSDLDLPRQNFTFQLGPNTPAGATIDDRGNFAWTPTASQAPSTHTVSITVTDNGNPPLSDTKSFTVEVQSVEPPKPPQIIVQPLSQTVPEGTNVVFSVKAIGAEPLSYQWRYNGIPISGATNLAHFLAAVTAAHEGEYTVLVSNPYGSTNSAVAMLTVLRKPVIIVPPRSLVAVLGGDASFNVVAQGSLPLSYQWRFNGIDIPNATESVLRLSPVQLSHVGDYTVVVANVAGSVTSSPPAKLELQVPTTLAGVVTDALDGKPVSGATVAAGIRSTTTDSEGRYVLTNLVVSPLKADFTADVVSGAPPLTVHFTNLSSVPTLTLTSEKANYVSYRNRQVNVVIGLTNQLNFSMSPVLMQGLRSVLDWGNIPGITSDDLDLHGHYVGGGQDVDIGYNNPVTRFGRLDHDRNASQPFGAETITMDQTFPGVYHFYVENLFFWTGSLTNSRAQLHIYRGSAEILVLSVPSSGSGNFWHICTFDGTTLAIQVVNQITDTVALPPGTGVPPPEPLPGVTLGNSPFLWEFGDGTTSTEENPVKIFSTAGVFTVRLHVSGANGQTIVEEKPSLVIVGSQTAPRLGLEWLNGLAVLKVTGTTGRTYRIESSPSLGIGTVWQTVATVPMNGPVASWTDTQSNSRPVRYYRAVSP